MKILIDISHPAHVHLFKHFAFEMEKRNHKIFFTAREKDVSKKLLQHYNFLFFSFGKSYKSIFGKLFGFFLFEIKLLYISLKFKPDIFINHGSFYSAIIAFILRKPNITMHNTDIDFLVKLYRPITSCFLTPNTFNKQLGKKQIYFDGNHELAFLHPKYFKPNPKVLNQFGITENDRFILFRFVSFNAYDDLGFRGIDDKSKVLIINKLKKYGKILISSENELPSILKEYHIEKNKNYKTGQLQDLEYYAILLFGESGAMTSECAVLGTPAFYISDKKLGFIDELVNIYSLAFTFKNYKDALKKATELLESKNLKSIWQQKAAKLLSDKIDVTSFLVWFVENYPDSFKIMKENPDYQYQFK